MVGLVHHHQVKPIRIEFLDAIRIPAAQGGHAGHDHVAVGIRAPPGLLHGDPNPPYDVGVLNSHHRLGLTPGSQRLTRVYGQFWQLWHQNSTPDGVLAGALSKWHQAAGLGLGKVLYPFP